MYLAVGIGCERWFNYTILRPATTKIVSAAGQVHPRAAASGEPGLYFKKISIFSSWVI
jgi:hypothetical protein